jgi:NTP pyrophosphatase (non-canonical NTP hydrolase)
LDQPAAQGKAREAVAMPGETSAGIAAWAEAAFGSVRDPMVLVERARLEFNELAEALGAGKTAEALTEAADIVILLHRLAHELGGDLAAAVDAKMRINRSRQWRATGDGVGGHIKIKPE